MTTRRLGSRLTLAAMAGLFLAACGGEKPAAPTAPNAVPAGSGGASKEAATVTVKCAGCGKAEVITAGATPPSC